MYICIHMCIYVYTYMYVYVYMCVYIHIYVCMCELYTHTCIHTHICVFYASSARDPGLILWSEDPLEEEWLPTPVIPRAEELF